jgi:hypothetical protein
MQRLDSVIADKRKNGNRPVAVEEYYELKKLQLKYRLPTRRNTIGETTYKVTPSAKESSREKQCNILKYIVIM